MRTAIAFGVLLGWVVAHSTETKAEETETQRMLVLRIEGQGIPAALVTMLETTTREVVSEIFPTWTLLPAPAVDLSSVQLAAGCTDDSPACMAGIGRMLSATRVLRVRLEGSVEKTHVSISMVLTANAHSQVRDFELIGLDEESHREYRWFLARALGTDLPPLVGSIELESGETSLEGATVYLNDRQIAWDALAGVEAGEHKVEVQKDGFEPSIWMGRVRGGRTTKVPLRLRPRIAELPKVEAPQKAETPVMVVDATEEHPGLAFTWVFGAGTAVSASMWGLWFYRWKAAEDDAREAGVVCSRDNLQTDNPTCRDGRQLVNETVAIGVTTGVLACATILAFFLEDGPRLVFGGEQKVAFGVAPLPGGGSGGLSLEF